MSTMIDNSRVVEVDEARVRRRFEAMAARFGLTPEDISTDPSLMRDVARVCAACSEAGCCDRAFDDGAVLPMTLCPNSAVYATLASE